MPFASGSQARSASSLSMILRALERLPSAASISRRGPSGRVTCAPVSPSPTRTSSTLPPPRSPIRPSASGMPDSTPSADRRASSSPLRMRTWKLQRSRHEIDEFAAVRSVADSGGADDVDALHPHRIRQRAEPRKALQRHPHAVDRQLAGRAQAARQTAQDLFVEDGGRRPLGAFIDHEANRIRADVDNGNRAVVGHHVGLIATRQNAWHAFRLASISKDAPAGTASRHCRGRIGWDWS